MVTFFFYSFFSLVYFDVFNPMDWNDVKCLFVWTEDLNIRGKNRFRSPNNFQLDVSSYYHQILIHKFPVIRNILFSTNRYKIFWFGFNSSNPSDKYSFLLFRQNFKNETASSIFHVAFFHHSCFSAGAFISLNAINFATERRNTFDLRQIINFLFCQKIALRMCVWDG